VDCPFDQYFERQVQELEKSEKDAGTQQAGVIPDIDITPPSSDADDNSAEEMPPPLKPAMRKGALREHDVDLGEADLSEQLLKRLCTKFLRRVVLHSLHPRPQDPTLPL